MLNDSMASTPARIRRSPGKGRAVFATAPIPKETLVFRALPYSSVICNAFRPEVCANCFLFTGGRSKWKVKSPKGRRWFCSEVCLEESRKEPWCDLLEECLQKIEDEVNRRKRLKQRRESQPQGKVLAGPAPGEDGKRLGSSGGNIEPLSKEERRVMKENRATEAGKDEDSAVEDLGLDLLSISEPAAARTLQSPADDDGSPRPEQLLDGCSQEEEERLSQWALLWEQPLSPATFGPDYVPTEDELDVARSVTYALCRRHVESDSSLREGGVEMVADVSLNDSVPSFADYWLLRNCERDYCLVLLRQLNLIRSGSKPRATVSDAFMRDVRAFRLLLVVLPQKLWTAPSSDLTPAELFRGVVYRERANTFGIWEPTDPAEAAGRPGAGEESEILGSAVYPTAAFFNHSCDPAMYRMQAGKAIEFYARRDIAEGEELTIAYGEVSDRLGERRNKLASEYFFLCDCSKCQKESSEQEKIH
ncbi:hypothetical protein DFJ74DRAFT_769738 [Hyaloraphidium curvatum]|nr:hypothetical protein DFJ74DRAFT_769738 [Hyaloraphidium curvatum]